MTVVSMTVNGKPVSAETEDRTLLVYFLREQLRLTGTHIGCDTSQCGACVVHVERASAVKSCTMFAVQAEGARGHHDRGPRQGRQAASGAGSVPRESRPAMRLLHAGHDHDGGRHDPPQARCSTARRSATSSKAISAAAPAITTSSRRSRTRPSAWPRREGGMIPYPFNYQPRQIARRGRGAARRLAGRQAARRRADAHRGDEDAAGQPVRPDRHLRPARSLSFIRVGERRGRHRRRHDAFRGRDVGRRRSARSPRSPTSPRSSAIRRCATRARSAARVANNDPAADYPAAVLALGATDQDQPAQHRGRRFLHRHVLDRARGRRDRHRGVVPHSANAPATRNSRNPASRYAMAGVFVAQDEGRRARRGDRRGALRLSRAGNGSGAGQELHARRDRRHRDRSPASSIPTSTARPNIAPIS